MTKTNATMTDTSKKNHAIEQPLPLEVSIRSDSWLTRARNYPVFSRTWYYYRVLSWVIPLSIIDVIGILISHLIGVPFVKIMMFLLPISLGLLALGLVGTGLAVWVRQRQFAERKEALMLVMAILFGVCLSYAAFEGSRKLGDWLTDESHVHGTLTLFDAHLNDTKEDVENKKRKNTDLASSSASLPTVSIDRPKGATPPVLTHPVLNQEMLELLRNAVNFSVSAFFIIYLVGGFDLWLFFRQKKRLLEDQHWRELKQAQEARREAELRLSVLVAQVEPHFLFNTLAGVRSAINTEPARATAIVDHLVEYLRATIPKFRSDGSSSQARLLQQLDAARAYLNLMQARIPRLSFSVESEIADAALPPLMLISLVENAIKHGVEPKVGPAHIAVAAHELVLDQQRVMELSVADDGVGFGGATSGSGIGLENIRERLASMYGDTASLTLKANQDGGVTAIIRLPLEK